MKSLIVANIVLFDLVTSAVMANADQLQCNLEDLSSLCKSLPQTDSTYVELPHGLRLLNPNRKDTRTAVPLTAEEKVKAQDRLNKYFTFVKDSMKEEILAGHKEPVNAQQEQWYKRIQTIELNIIDCKRPGEGGSYRSNSHKINICLGEGLSSVSQLVWLLSHETGHCIDGCTSQQAFFKRIEHLPYHQSATETTRTIQEMNSSNYFVADFESILSNPKEIRSNLDNWEQKSFITRKDNGIAAQDFPLAPVLSCLVKEGFISENASKVKEGDTCREGVVSETPSDIWAARIVGKALVDTPPKTDLEKLAVLQRESIALMCGKVNPKQIPLNSPKWSKQRPSNFRYIIERDRDEATLLSDQNVLNALACKPLDGRGKCMQLFAKSMKEWAERGPQIKTATPSIK